MALTLKWSRFGDLARLDCTAVPDERALLQAPHQRRLVFL